MLARGELEIEADIGSDTAPLAALVERILDAAPRARCMRDATRGGVATVLNEIAAASGSPYYRSMNPLCRFVKK